VIVRGQIWWADLGEPVGSEPGYSRPVVIVQSDRLHRTGLRTTLAVTLTSNLLLADMPGNVVVSRKDSGLPKDSVANVSQLSTLDLHQLRDLVGAVPSAVMGRIESGLRFVLDLP